MSTTAQRLPVAFVSHGGGPSFFLPDEGRMKGLGAGSHAHRSLQTLFKRMLLPRFESAAIKAIVVISAHWEEDDEVHIVSSAQPKLLFDYGGFPRSTYELKLDNPGSPTLATRIQSLLQQQGIGTRLDEKRGLDHGTFIPMLVALPLPPPFDQHIPIVQVSLLSSLNPQAHIDIGRALAPLRDEGVLLIGSGFITHNFNPDAKANKQFVDAINSKLTNNSVANRLDSLLRWRTLPGAKLAHPREEHLIPLHVIVGAAGEDQCKVMDHIDDNPSFIFANYAFGL